MSLKNGWETIYWVEDVCGSRINQKQQEPSEVCDVEHWTMCEMSLNMEFFLVRIRSFKYGVKYEVFKYGVKYGVFKYGV